MQWSCAGNVCEIKGKWALICSSRTCMCVGDGGSGAGATWERNTESSEMRNPGRTKDLRCKPHRSYRAVSGPLQDFSCLPHPQLWPPPIFFSVSMKVVFFFFKVPHMSKIIQCLSFFIWLISLNTSPQLSSVLFQMTGFLPFIWLHIFHCNVNIHHIFFIHSSVNRHRLFSCLGYCKSVQFS